MGQSVRIGNTGFSSGFSSGFLYEIPVVSTFVTALSPTVSAGSSISVSPETITLSASVPIVGTTTDQILQPTILDVGSSALPIDVLIDSVVSASTSTLSVSALPVGLILGSTTSATTVEMALIPLPVGVTIDVPISATTNEISVSAIPPTLVINSLITPSTAIGNTSALSPDINIDVSVLTDTTSATLDVPNHLIGCDDCSLILPAYLNIEVPEHTVCILVPDWDTGRDTPNDYWDVDNGCYEKSKCLFDNIQISMVNQYGIDLTFYTTDYNTSHDIIFGEDNDRHVLRSFEVMSLFDLPEHNESFDKMGIFGLDEFHMYINKSHFSYMSTTSGDVEDVYPDYIPHVGDIVCYNAENRYYEIISVKDKVNQFLQSQYTWDFLVRPFRDNKLTLSPDTSSSPISTYVDTPDILEVNDVINNEVSAVNYQPPFDEQDPWSQW